MINETTVTYVDCLKKESQKTNENKKSKSRQVHKIIWYKVQQRNKMSKIKLEMNKKGKFYIPKQFKW